MKFHDITPASIMAGSLMALPLLFIFIYVISDYIEINAPLYYGAAVIAVTFWSVLLVLIVHNLKRRNALKNKPE